MGKLGILLDDHDRDMLRALAYVALERHLGGGTIIRRLVYHLDAFQADILPKLEVPPVEGETRKFCLGWGDKERELSRHLAQLRGWTVTDLIRALMAYHWELTEAYRQSLPALTYREGMGGLLRRLSFQPDRLQPWYFHNIEAHERMEATALESRQVWLAKMKERGASQEEVEDFMQAVELARDVRDGYAWADIAQSPAEMQEKEKAAGPIRLLIGTNQYSGMARGGFDFDSLALVGSILVVLVGAAAGGIWAFVNYFPQLQAQINQLIR